MTFSLADLVSMFHSIPASMASSFNSGITPPAQQAVVGGAPAAIAGVDPASGITVSGADIPQVGTDNSMGPTTGAFVPTQQGQGFNLGTLGQVASLVAKAASKGAPAAGNVTAPALAPLPLVAASNPGNINWSPTK